MSKPTNNTEPQRKFIRGTCSKCRSFAYLCESRHCPNYTCTYHKCEFHYKITQRERTRFRFCQDCGQNRFSEGDKARVTARKNCFDRPPHLNNEAFYFVVKEQKELVIDPDSDEEDIDSSQANPLDLLEPSQGKVKCHFEDCDNEADEDIATLEICEEHFDRLCSQCHESETDQTLREKKECYETKNCEVCDFAFCKKHGNEFVFTICKVCWEDSSEQTKIDHWTNEDLQNRSSQPPGKKEEPKETCILNECTNEAEDNDICAFHLGRLCVVCKDTVAHFDDDCFITSDCSDCKLPFCKEHMDREAEPKLCTGCKAASQKEEDDDDDVVITGVAQRQQTPPTLPPPPPAEPQRSPSPAPKEQEKEVSAPPRRIPTPPKRHSLIVTAPPIIAINNKRKRDEEEEEVDDDEDERIEPSQFSPDFKWPLEERRTFNLDLSGAKGYKRVRVKLPNGTTLMFDL